MPRNRKSETKPPWKTLRRDGPRASALVALLEEHKVTLRGAPVTGRGIETLSGDGLVPDDDDEFVAVVGVLNELGYGPGKSADEVSLRLLARGHGVGRVRKVLTENAPDLSQLDGNSLPVGIVGEILGTDTGSMKLLAPLLQMVSAALADAPAAGRLDYAGARLHETPDTRTAGFFDDVGRMMAGETVVDPELHYDVVYHPEGPFGQDPKRYERVGLPDEIDTVEQVADQVGSAFAAYSQVVENAPLAVLAQAAVVARAMLSIIPNAVVPGFDDRSRDLLAAWIAPLMIGLRQTGWKPHPSKAAGLRPAPLEPPTTAT